MSSSRFFEALCLKLILAASALIIGCQAFAESASEDEKGRNLPAWTIMAYIDGDNNLEKQLIFNLLEMEQAKPDGIEIIVFMDRSGGRWKGHGGWSGARIYRVRKNADLPPEQIASDV
ncbi:MAG: hypothetical protein IJ523_09035 [Succinivibrionaceae bacterium]|nr:hypothetical protein [Succinivibrionaceae bacterium]